MADARGSAQADVGLDVGSRVRIDATDPAHHTRVPRYLRGHVGVVLDVRDDVPFPEDCFTHVEPQRHLRLYTVRFKASELWGVGGHSVTAQCWEPHVHPTMKADWSGGLP